MPSFLEGLYITVYDLYPIWSKEKIEAFECKMNCDETCIQNINALEKPFEKPPGEHL